MKKSLCVVTVLALLTGAGCTASRDDSAPTDAPLTVSTTSGVLHGKTVGSTRQFTAVRYAQPPVGPRRWTLPQSISARGTQVDATGPARPCQQSAGAASGGTQIPPSEDCLYLNVTTPRRQSADDRLPVMVWWHGGGFTTGAGGAYDPQRMADTGNVIVVTVNYRLGVFGYLGLPGLAGSGNFGFADQLESVRWAKRNADAFGGDPGNIMVFGESAGGMSTCAAITSPAARGLIDKAAISSGSCALQWPAGTFYPGAPKQTPYVSLADNVTTGVAAAKSIGCTGPDTLACLRSAPVDRLLTTNENFSNDLAYGTELLPANPADAVRAGDTLRVPVISGGNHDENRAFTGGVVLAEPNAITPATYSSLLSTAFGVRADDVALRYPLSRYASAPLAWATVLTDSAWSCPTARANRDFAAHGPVYSYEFADVTARDVGGIDTPLVPQSATHAADLPYLFDIGGRNLVPTGSRAELSHRMIEYWTSFAHTGAPRADGAATWSRTTTTSTSVLSFDETGVRHSAFDIDHQCSFWDTVTLP